MDCNPLHTSLSSNSWCFFIIVNKNTILLIQYIDVLNPTKWLKQLTKLIDCHSTCIDIPKPQMTWWLLCLNNSSHSHIQLGSTFRSIFLFLSKRDVSFPFGLFNEWVSSILCFFSCHEIHKRITTLYDSTFSFYLTSLMNNLHIFNLTILTKLIPKTLLWCTQAHIPNMKTPWCCCQFAGF